MPDYSVVTEKLVRGNDRDIIRDVTGIPTGVTLTDAYLTVHSASGPGATLFEKHITTSLVAGQGQIEDTGSGDGVGRLRFEMTSVNTLTLAGGTDAAPTNHPYGIEVITSVGKKYEDEQGVIPVLEQLANI